MSFHYFVLGVVGTMFVAFAVLSSLAVTANSSVDQPIQYSHRQHCDYFLGGEHRRFYVKVHTDLLGETPESLTRGDCLDCHDNFEDAAEDTPAIAGCALCHELFLDTPELRERREILPCVGCHQGVVSQREATIPPNAICAACHTETRTNSASEQQLRTYLQGQDAIPWVRVYDYLPGDIYFSHERHVTLGKVACQECHGPVQTRDRPLAREVALTMEDCMRCHETMNASNDCLACHR